MRAWRALVAAAGSGGIAACSLLTSYDGLVPSPQGAPDASAPDAVVDGKGDLDVARPPDASRDAGFDSAPLVVCDGGHTACGPVCVDLTSDPSNCGACGHDCQGGACTVGACQALTLATGQSNPGPILVAGGTLYWANEGCCAQSIAECALPGCGTDGGSGVTTFATVGNQVPALATDPAVTTLYWLTQNNGLFGCPLGSHCAQPQLLATSNNNDNQLATIVSDTTGIYWNSKNGIEECRAGGCDGGLATTYASLNNLSGFTGSSGNLYWSIDCCPTAIEVCGEGASCSSPNALPVPFTNTKPAALFATPTTLYWTTQNNPGLVQSCLLPACNTVTTLAANESSPSIIVADANGAYWATNQGLRACSPIPCASPSTLWSGGSVNGLTVDSTTVYFTTSSDVMKVAR